MIKRLFNTGNVTVKRWFEPKNIDDDVYITYERVLDKDVVDSHLNKRHTGFMLDWYFEDADGNKVDIETDKNRFSGDEGNKMFLNFMDFLYKAVTIHNVRVETIWNIARRYRLDYLHRKVEGKVPYCVEDKVIHTNDFIGNISSELNITFKLHKYPKYKAKINDSFLSEGFQIFTYIARCEDMDKMSAFTIKTHIYSFNNNSALTLLEASIKMKNIAARQLTDLKNLNAGKKLMEKIDNLYGLDIDKLDILSSTLSDLKTRVAAITYKNISCLYEDTCEHLEQLLKTLGKAYDLM